MAPAAEGPLRPAAPRGGCPCRPYSVTRTGLSNRPTSAGTSLVHSQRSSLDDEGFRARLGGDAETASDSLDALRQDFRSDIAQALRAVRSEALRPKEMENALAEIKAEVRTQAFKLQQQLQQALSRRTADECRVANATVPAYSGAEGLAESIFEMQGTIQEVLSPKLMSLGEAVREVRDGIRSLKGVLSAAPAPVVKSPREPMALVEEVRVMSVSIQRELSTLREMTKRNSSLEGLQASVDFSPVLQELRDLRAKHDSGVADLLDSAREGKTAVLKEIHDLNTQNDADLSAIIAAVKGSRGALDLSPLVAEIRQLQPHVQEEVRAATAAMKEHLNSTLLQQAVSRESSPRPELSQLLAAVERCEEAIRKNRDELDLSPVLAAIERCKSEVDFEPVLEAISMHRNELDLSPVIAAIESCRSEMDAEPDVDFEPILEAIRSNRVELDLSPVLAAIERCKSEVDFSPVLEAISMNRVEMDLSPVISAIQCCRSEMEAEPELDFGPVLEAIAKKRFEVDFGPVLEAISSTESQVLALQPQIESSTANMLDTAIDGKIKLGFSSVLKAIEASTKEVNDKIDLSPVLEAISRNGAELDLSPVLAAIERSKYEVDFEPVFEAIASSRVETDLRPIFAAIENCRAEVDAEPEADFSPILEAIGAVRTQVEAVQARVADVPPLNLLKEIKSLQAQLATVQAGAADAAKAARADVDYLAGAVAADNTRRILEAVESRLDPSRIIDFVRVHRPEVDFSVVLQAIESNAQGAQAAQQAVLKSMDGKLTGVLAKLEDDLPRREVPTKLGGELAGG